jgi:RNA polymerase sigma-70 factor (ECF subfamily)
MRYTETVHDVSVLFEENKDRLFAYLIRMTGDFDLADDILQESFTRYMEHYTGNENSVSLLYTIARNALIDHTRKHRHHVELDGEHKDHSGDLEHTLMIRENYRRVIKGFEALEQEERDILSLAISSELPYHEIAAVTGMSVANIKVKVHRARVKLRKIFSGEES